MRRWRIRYVVRHRSGRTVTANGERRYWTYRGAQKVIERTFERWPHVVVAWPSRG